MVVLIIILIILVFVVLKQYNKLIKQKNLVKQAKSGIDIYLNQRFVFLVVLPFF